MEEKLDRYVKKEQLEQAIEVLLSVAKDKKAAPKDRMGAVAGIFHADEHYWRAKLEMRMLEKVEEVGDKVGEEGEKQTKALGDVKKLLKNKDRKAWDPPLDDDEEDEED